MQQPSSFDMTTATWQNALSILVLADARNGHAVPRLRNGAGLTRPPLRPHPGHVPKGGRATALSCLHSCSRGVGADAQPHLTRHHPAPLPPHPTPHRENTSKEQEWTTLSRRQRAVCCAWVLPQMPLQCWWEAILAATPGLATRGWP